ncbi:MAG: SagB/ThcOx family dehydrogenase [Anaerolineae bacterium]
MDAIQQGRGFLKADRWEEWETQPTDQRRGIPRPPLEKPCPGDAPLVDLIAPKDFAVGNVPLLDLIRQRRSRRRFSLDPLSLEEISFLLWSTQGVHEVYREGVATRRTVPSAGARHPFETYLAVGRVEGLEPGLYRYLPLSHRLCQLCSADALLQQLAGACYGQEFVAHAAAVFIWSVIPYRTEWRYTVTSPKLIALDAGHVCQNLYLACEAVGAGTCAIGAYNQAAVDALLGLDGKDEFAVYLAPVGKLVQAAPNATFRPPA